tara:strand:+ start:208 stop:576 length:369 start_codon:yes stop_codon:yes gene_type:complete
MIRNPKWQYSELVLALELYMLYRPNPPGKNSREVKILSNLLRLNALSNGIVLNKFFRNTNGVAMKLQNFRRFDPMFKGTGLRAGGNMEHEIWERYQNLDKLKKTAERIRNNIEIKMKDLIHD